MSQLSSQMQEGPGEVASPPGKRLEEAVLRIAGNSQDGIQSIGVMLARLAGRSDMEVMTYMTIPATISGGASIFQVHMGTGEILSPGDDADILVVFYQHSYDRHLPSLRDGGLLLYDSSHVEPDNEGLQTRGIKSMGLPITELTIETVGGSGKQKGKNIYLLGLLANLFHFDLGKARSLVEARFRKQGDSVVRNALLALEAGWAYSLGELSSEYRLCPAETRGVNKVTMTGNQALAYGIIAAGVRFGAGYPITPWTDTMEQLRQELPFFGGTFLQTEDELAAISAAIGAAYGGVVAMTGTSGPGLSLYSEAISFAVMAEIPLLIVDVQRGGPSTGLPTNVEQSDLELACYGAHGDSPRVVMAPARAEECFYLAIEAVDIAYRYSLPVVFLSDQAIATRIESFKMPKPDRCMQLIVSDRKPRPYHKPYPLDSVTRHVAPGTRLEDGAYPHVTGLEHDEYGYPSVNPEMHTAMTRKRHKKLDLLASELPVPEVDGPMEGEILIVGWGSTEGVIRKAVDRLRSDVSGVGGLHLRHLSPLPPGLTEIFDRFERIYVVEMNDGGRYGCGQLGRMLRMETCCPRIQGINKTEGLSFRVDEIVDRIREPRGAEASNVRESRQTASLSHE